jgi:hypothetical protein
MLGGGSHYMLHPRGDVKKKGGAIYGCLVKTTLFETADTPLEKGILSTYLQQWYLWSGVNQPVAVWENVRNCYQ